MLTYLTIMLILRMFGVKTKKVQIPFLNNLYATFFRKKSLATQYISAETKLK
jgi:hypothetical protein